MPPFVLNPGTLRHTIQIVSTGSQKDSFGEDIAADTSIVLTTRASIAVVNSKEIYSLGAGFTAQVSHKIIIRYPQVKIRSSMRVLYDGRTFDIQTVQDPDERKRYLFLICLELDEGVA